jgi:hypothetical protein
MDILDLLTRSGTYVLAVAVFVCTFFVRKIVELVWPSLKKQADANSAAPSYLTPLSRWWNEVILYALPVVFGALSAVADSEFLFEGIDGGAKVLYGCGVGWFSGFLYKALKKAVANKVNVDELPGDVP